MCSHAIKLCLFKDLKNYKPSVRWGSALHDPDLIGSRTINTNSIQNGIIPHLMKLREVLEVRAIVRVSSFQMKL